MNNEQQNAIADFIASVVDDDGYVKDLKEDAFLNRLNKLARSFERVTIKYENVTRKESEKIAKVSKAIKDLNRLGINPTLKNISKIVRTNPRRMRNLMVKYGMFDPEKKKIINPYDDDPFKWELQLGDEDYEKH